MKYNNIIYLFLSVLLFNGCASTVSFNKGYESRNIALVKDTVFNPIFSIKSKSATVTKIDDKETNYTSTSNEIISGIHILQTKCTYYETSSLVYANKHPLNVNLVKGHTYKLVPVLVANDFKKKITCISKLIDITKI